MSSHEVSATESERSPDFPDRINELMHIRATQGQDAFLRRCAESLNSDGILDAVYEFIELARQTKEGGLATTFADSQAIIYEMTSELIHVAIEAIRVTYWTPNARNLLGMLTTMRETHSSMITFCRSKRTAEIEMEEMRRLSGGVGNTPEAFCFKNLCKFNPLIYDSYTANLNHLITVYNNFVMPRFKIGYQAIQLGRVACVLASNLCAMIGDTDGKRFHMFGLYFSTKNLMGPVILHPEKCISRILDEEKIGQLSISSQMDITDVMPRLQQPNGTEHVLNYVFASKRIRDLVENTLVCEWEYDPTQLAAVKKSTIFTVDHFFDDKTPICAYALLSHDVTCPAETTSPVVIQHFEVKPDYRRCGIGRMLLKFLALRATRNGYKLLTIPATQEVSSKWLFWERMGFRPSNISEGWHDLITEPMILMKRDKPGVERQERSQSPLLDLRIAIETLCEAPDAAP
jgi:GNAT superfamily N-acetyltransferase